jgi:MFS family permease
MSANPTLAAIPHRRWWIGVLLGSGILVNYFDRIALSVAAPQLQQEFSLDATEVGLMFSVFFWSYALLQIPVGMILDRFGVMPIGRIGGAMWSAATALTALATGFGGVIAARIVLGVAEASAFPGNAKATGYWFPRSERGLATAIFDSAAKFANVIGAPLVALAVVWFGWRGAFWSMAVLNLAYFVAYCLWYRDPGADKGLNYRAGLYPHRRRRCGGRGRNRRRRHARLPLHHPQSLGTDDRVCRIRLFVRAVPDLAAWLSRARTAHGYFEVCRIYGDPLAGRDDC